MTDKQLKSDFNRNYMKNYMKERYHKNPLKAQKYRNTLRIKRQFQISDSVARQFKDDLYNIVRIKHLVDELNEGSFEQFLIQMHSLQFPKLE